VTPSIEEVLYLDEPRLQFGEAQFAVDPRDGLALFGPYSQGKPSHPVTPAYMVIGAPEGIRAMQAWAIAMNSAHAAKQTTTTPLLKLHRLWPPYPGFEAAFGSRWSETPAATFELDRDSLLEASRKRDGHERCFAVVEQFMAAFEKSRKHDTKIAVAICVVPDDVWANCRPESRVVNPSDTGISSATKKSRARPRRVVR
jgi:hypothetical protein